MEGDRRWAVRDEVRGGIRGAKKIGDLMRFAATSRERGGVTITCPDGATIESDDADRDVRLSEALDHQVTLQALPSAEDLEHFRRGGPDSDDIEVELRDMFGREPDEPLPDLAAFPPEVFEFESPPGTYYDAFPLLIMTTSALRSLAAAIPESVVDVRRFRPSMVIDTGDAAGHPEFDWVGRRLRIGRTELEIAMRCPRCVMVTRSIDDVTPEDRSILRHIVRDLSQDVGVYATVVREGEVRTGDVVALV
jgi:uncharacterized protein YcbX